jgi:hypothetical protein
MRAESSANSSHPALFSTTKTDSQVFQLHSAPIRAQQKCARKVRQGADLCQDKVEQF